MFSWFIGLWPIFSHYTVGVTIIGACIVVFIFSSALVAEVPLLKPFLAVIREWALIVAIGVAAGLFIYAWGVRDGQNRIKAQWRNAEQVAAQQATDARAAATRVTRNPPTPGELRRDPYNRDN